MQSVSSRLGGGGGVISGREDVRKILELHAKMLKLDSVSTHLPALVLQLIELLMLHANLLSSRHTSGQQRRRYCNSSQRLQAWRRRLQGWRGGVVGRLYSVQYKSIFGMPDKVSYNTCDKARPLSQV